MDQLNESLNNYKVPIAVLFVGLVLIIGGVFSSGLVKPGKSDSKKILIKVDVSGAVNNPSVYSLNIGSRTEDAIKTAGGFRREANKEYISKNLNLSAKLIDGQKIYVPFDGEPSGQSVSGVQINKINLNNATQKELEALPGIGSATALKITASRPYADTSELLSKKVISRSIYEKIKDLVDVN